MFDRNAHGGDWVPTLLSLEPDLAPALARVGIRDERSYLDREGAMPRRIRNEVALARRDLLLLDGIPLRDLVRVSPPWLRALTLLEIGTPQPVAEHLSRSGVTRVEDMITMAEVPGGEAAARVLRLALYRAGRSGAPKSQQTPAPAPDRVIGLVGTAPEEVRSMAFTDLPGLPSRAVNAARSAGIRSVGDLAHWSDKDLKMLPCFGEGTLQGVLCSLECAMEGAVVSVEEEQEPCP